MRAGEEWSKSLKKWRKARLAQPEEGGRHRSSGVGTLLVQPAPAWHYMWNTIVPYRVVGTSEVTLGYKLMRTYEVGPLGP